MKIMPSETKAVDRLVIDAYKHLAEEQEVLILSVQEQLAILEKKLENLKKEFLATYDEVYHHLVNIEREILE